MDADGAERLGTLAMELMERIPDDVELEAAVLVVQYAPAGTVGEEVLRTIEYENDSSGTAHALGLLEVAGDLIRSTYLEGAD